MLKFDQNCENQVRVDHHNHTDKSDGVLDPIDFVLRSYSRNRVAAPSDHNSVAAVQAIEEKAKEDPVFREFADSSTFPGTEVQSRQRSELLIYGSTRKKLISFFFRKVYPFLSTANPIYDRTNIHIVDLVRECRVEGMFITIPHFALVQFGLKHVNRKIMSKVKAELTSHSGYCAVEVTPVQDADQNAESIAFANSIGVPVVAGSDSHDFEPGSSFTDVCLNSNTSNTPLEEYFYQIHRKPPTSDHLHVEQWSGYSKFKRFIAVMRQSGVGGTISTLVDRAHFSPKQTAARLSWADSIPH